MKKRQRSLVALVVVAAVSVYAAFFVNREPEVDVAEELFGQYRLLVKYRTMAEESAKMSGVADLEKELEGYEKRFLKSESASLASAELQRVVSDHAVEAGLQLQTVKPMSMVEQGEYVEVPLLFEFRGKIQGIRDLVDRIESEEFGLRVSRMSVSVTNVRQPEDLNVKIAVHGIMRL